ncbi:LacI family DNA-binding transcriptional regulator [Tropicimonas sp. TH_r6]|uniref:LacI family DNA-binding transcriptional regulator n=1 Tax=Tropicimonas sp. TH_r6 TaxID=3082085 RepID=UPI0029532D62|nr:LacI family DNA-binding transcriptional regulator [Tropicimonas sp. TH_r6]MDV7144244.1 LacI family DNA-binding transcriptional regulator [Tropicimonas sp. TH_r6]
MKTSSRPTLKTVAEISGLAVATVSRALANDPKIAEATRARVAKVAASVGYVPDRAARRLRTGKTMVVNLMLDPHFEILGFGNALLVGLTTALEGSGYNLVVTPHFTDVDSLTPIQHIVTNRQADGVIFTRTAPFDERVRFLQERGFPFVCHGRTEFTEPHAWVDFDNEAFAYAAAMRLIGKGCRRICAVLPPESLTFRQHLRYGLMRAVRESGVDYHIPTSITLDSPIDAIHDWASHIAGTPDRPDGFICPGEASYLAIRNGYGHHGYKVGWDFHAVAKSISGILSQIDPETDTIHEDVEAAGRIMARRIVAMLANPEAGLSQDLQPIDLRFAD